MPHSLLNFVFDFGSVNNDDEKKYIKNMIEGIIKEKDLYELSTELIIIAQNFIRDNNDISSVSLREIRRFILFYKFFIDYFEKKKITYIEEKIKEDKIQYSKLNEYQIKLYSINLSIYLGYYLRLLDSTSNEDLEENGGIRKGLYEKLNDIFIKKVKIDFLLIPGEEENFIADNVDLEKGIAKNRALLENLFSLFVAINVKIPIFIVGKPGCSKSLSVQLINNAMKGKMSNNPFFRKYPKMYVSTYQGALNSTSEGVKAIFDKAREILKISKNKKGIEEIIEKAKQLKKNEKEEGAKETIIKIKKILENKENLNISEIFEKLRKIFKFEEKISTIYFDEMGLAEHSPHNPLKVIHSELEYDLNEDDKKVSFLGVSNWSLDSSKMNRGITINIPEPNEEDIKTTSITIANSYLKDMMEKRFENFFNHLGSSYYKYKKEFKKDKLIKKFDDFHGNRIFII